MSETRVPDAHDWFRSRVDPHLLGLLGERSEARFLQHAGVCGECGALVRSRRAALRDVVRGGAHIPVRVLARWDVMSPKLRGISRHIVRRHLEQCDECRQDLEVAGYRAELERVPELEADIESDPPVKDDIAAPAFAIVPGRAGPERKPEGRRTWAPWVLGGMAGASLTAAGFLVYFGSAPHGGPARDSIATMGGPSGGEPAAGASLTIAALPSATALPARMRGGEAQITTIRTGPGERFIHVILPDLFLEESASVTVTLWGPDGTEIGSLTGAGDELSRSRSLALGSAERPIQPGLYRLTVRKNGTAGSAPEQAAEFQIEIVER